MNVMPEKCPVAPRFKGKAQVITFWGLLSLARFSYICTGAVLIHRPGHRLSLAIVDGCHPATRLRASR